MVKSMTGFGRAASEEGRDKVFSVEIKSVNHRYLDINTRMPKAMIPLEEKIRRKIKEYLNRGKVDLFINYKNYGKSDSVATLNLDFAKTYVEALKVLKNEFSDLKDDLSLSLVSRHPEVISIEEKEESLDEIWEEISNLLDISLKAMLEMREFEGDKLKEDIILKSNEIENLVSKIEEKSTLIVENYKSKLEERLTDILGKIEVDENRLAMEVAIFADKAAIDEEIIRLKSHIKHLRETLELSEPIGRKLDFIMQEMNREANTIASKSTDLDITNNVIDIKNTLEKIREQVQNIE
ncbi:YicC/YloC family endoribonuclease [Clostridium mediterraneense]|uniref:YicC/YloC family endoribonuclease n=1 Tax=Clostridium mediterraneense TaxID=1805472 RepID=UPI000832D336|nr:YicC/YloC family endoribonuclease [Clostridium mediterraneense]